MKGKCFIDSNIFLYAFSNDDAKKRLASTELLLALSTENQVVISTQVLNEVAAQLFRKKELRIAEIRSILDFLKDFEIERTNLETILGAIEIKELHQFSYWDSLIIAAADKMKCKFLISEDLQNGQEIKGITVYNPFV